jgi:hypothetical protein
MGKSQRTPPLAVGVNGKAGDLGAAAPVRAKLARASSLRKLPEGGDFPEAPALCAGELH